MDYVLRFIFLVEKLERLLLVNHFKWIYFWPICNFVHVFVHFGFQLTFYYINPSHTHKHKCRSTQPPHELSLFHFFCVCLALLFVFDVSLWLRCVAATRLLLYQIKEHSKEFVFIKCSPRRHQVPFYTHTHTQSIQLTSSFARNLNGCAQILSATLHSMRAQQAQVISKVIKQ